MCHIWSSSRVHNIMYGEIYGKYRKRRINSHIILAVEMVYVYRRKIMFDLYVHDYIGCLSLVWNLIGHFTSIYQIVNTY